MEPPPEYGKNVDSLWNSLRLEDTNSLSCFIYIYIYIYILKLECHNFMICLVAVKR